MKKLLLIAAAALALCLAACDKDNGGGSSSSAGFKAVKYSNLMFDIVHFAQELTPTFEDGKLVKIVEKGWNSTTWTEDGKPANIILSRESVYTLKWDDKTKKISGTISDKYYDEESGKLVPAEKTETISGTFDADGKLTSYSDGFFNKSYTYSGKQLTKVDEYNYSWEGGNIVRHDVWNTTYANVTYGDEEYKVPAHADILKGFMVSGDIMVVLGLCGETCKKIPVSHTEITPGEYGSSMHYVFSYKKDASGRLVSITRQLTDATTGEPIGDSHVERWEIIY